MTVDRFCKVSVGLLLCVLISISICDAQLLQHVFGQAARRKPAYSAICVIAKNENQYLREWLEYHRCIGVDKVYVYDHNSSIPLSTGMEDLIRDGYLEYIPFSGQHQRYADGFSSDLQRFMTTIQGQAYKDCVTRFSARHTFMGFIDVDEFIAFHDPAIKNINEFLKWYQAYAGVSLYWELLGSSGHLQPPAAGVVASYHRCLPLEHKYNTQFKSFVNTLFRPTMYSPHRASFGVVGPFSFLVDENRRRIAQGRNKNCTHARAAVYHYSTKSRADFQRKRKRGGGAGVTRPSYYLRKLDEQCTHSCSAVVNTLRRALAAGSCRLTTPPTPLFNVTDQVQVQVRAGRQHA